MMRLPHTAASLIPQSGANRRAMRIGMAIWIVLSGCSSAGPRADVRLTPPGTVVLSDRFRGQYGARTDTAIERGRDAVAPEVVRAAEAMATDSTYDPMCNRYFPTEGLVVVVFVHACDIPLHSFDRATVVGAFSPAGQFLGNRLQDFGWLESLKPLTRPPWDSARARKTKVIRIGPNEIGKPIPFDSAQQRDTTAR